MIVILNITLEIINIFSISRYYFIAVKQMLVNMLENFLQKKSSILKQSKIDS